ncbi:MAG TPA: hypothetical protein VM030_01395 [Acidimicrobiales bacterium]|nr:hypothetical protein [Acidimicrobiales bacterium]
MATDPSPDVVLSPLGGEARPLREWLTTFHLAVVFLDPFTDESSWILGTAGRILRTFEQADVRVAWCLTAEPHEARMFLGPWAKDTLTFTDPDRAVVKAFGLERLPAFVHVAMDTTVAAAAEGWDPPAWRSVADGLATVTAWTAPVIPVRGDPGPFEGSPAA